MLKKFFNKYGIVERAVVNREHYTDFSRGSGFILFKESNSAQKVLDEEKPFILNNKIFYCQPCLLRNEVKNKKIDYSSSHHTDYSKKKSPDFQKLGRSVSRAKPKKKEKKRRQSIKSLDQNNNHQKKEEVSVDSPSERSYEDSWDLSNFVESERRKRKLRKIRSFHVHEFEKELKNEKRRRITPPSSIKGRETLFYSPPKFRPKQDDYVNKNRKQNYSNRPINFNKCRINPDYPERRATPCNFEFPETNVISSHLMLFKPEPVSPPKMSDCLDTLRKPGQPKNNYVLNRGELAWNVLRRKQNRRSRMECEPAMMMLEY